MVGPLLGSILVVVATGCSEPGTPRSAPRVESVASVGTVQNASRFAVDVSVKSEIVSGNAIVRAQTQSYHVEEVRDAGGGWSAILTFAPLDRSLIPPGMRPPTSLGEIARMEFDATNGLPKMYTRDGRLRSNTPPGISQGVFDPSKVGDPRLFGRPNLPPVVPRARGPRPGLLASLVVSAEAGISAREALRRIHGVPVIEIDGRETFTSRARDTVRTIVFDPSAGSVAEMGVSVGGVPSYQVRHEFGELASGVMGRTGLVVERRLPESKQADVYMRITIGYRNTRIQ